MAKRGADTSVALLERYTRLFNAEASKDVTFKLADGEQKAHKCVLEASSEVFAGMFEQDMRERKDGVVELPTVDKVSMRIFLRLLYTSHMDPSDWHDASAPKDCLSGVRVLRQKNFKITGCKFEPEAEEWESLVLLDARSRSFEISVKLPGQEDPHLVMGIEPMTTATNDGTTEIFTTDAMGVEVGISRTRAAAAVIAIWKGEGCEPSGDSCSSSLSVAPDSVLTCTYNGTTGSLAFSLNGRRLHLPMLTSAADTEKTYCPAISVASQDDAFEVVEVKALDCPLDSLLGVVSLAKKYMVDEILSSSTQALKRRLEDAKLSGSVATFEQILAAAIRYDMAALRLGALRLAENFVELREKYNSKSLKPEVLHELEAIWPPPEGHGESRQMYFALA
eukprot:TRINITY_DN17507_c0_g1_i3.p1 TRINITY_DN17507_c0_g1~~TRINITY_DN17507_c0_g1_i3.p1  ORF type:complete len:393 (-),score=44.02 TRINITY_DN17507_c0_g1_i3:285-1463(-)